PKARSASTTTPATRNDRLGADERLLPSWEGSGVGRFMEAPPFGFRMHWDHERTRPRARPGRQATQSMTRTRTKRRFMESAAAGSSLEQSSGFSNHQASWLPGRFSGGSELIASNLRGTVRQ